ncbi:MAG: DUF4919 domain-containing protein [Bryobacteraceae bacterium]
MIAPLAKAGLLLALMAPLFVTAQAPEDPDSAYRVLVKHASAGDLSIDFRALRFACLKSAVCDARGGREDLMTMRRAFAAKDYDQARKSAEALIDKGFPNIEAHVIAARAYTELGDSAKAKLHHEISMALIHSILSTGDGKTQETAFEVIGTFEEYTIMSVLGLPRSASQALITGKPHSYDRLEVNDPKTGEKVAVFFNIDAFFPSKAF